MRVYLCEADKLSSDVQGSTQPLRHIDLQDSAACYLIFIHGIQQMRVIFVML